MYTLLKIISYCVTLDKYQDPKIIVNKWKSLHIGKIK